MDELNEKKTIEKAISENEMILIYFGGKSCSVCNVMNPKVEELIGRYPIIKSFQVDVEKNPEISAIYNIFTIPAILVFVEGKEVIREARYISIQDIDNKIERYYGLLF